LFKTEKLAAPLFDHAPHFENPCHISKTSFLNPRCMKQCQSQYTAYIIHLTLKYKIYVKSVIMFTLNYGLAADAATKFEHSTTKSAPKI